MKKHEQMGRRDYFFYDGKSVFEYVEQDVAPPTSTSLEDPFYVYIMGPYTAFNATYAFDDGDQLEEPYIDDPLFDPAKHVNRANRADYEAALSDICDSLRNNFGLHTFIATDVNSIPTISEAGASEPGLSVLDQSVSYAAVADAAIMIFSEAGLTTGVGSEAGAILSDFNLRKRNPEPDRKPRERIGIFATESFSSASIDEIPYTYDIPRHDFTTKSGLVRKIGNFIINTQRTSQGRPLPRYSPF